MKGKFRDKTEDFAKKKENLAEPFNGKLEKLKFHGISSFQIIVPFFVS